MRKTSTSLILAGLVTALALAACGGGGGGGGSANRAPVANAGSPQTVATGAMVTLNGSGSSDPDGTVASYQWTQTSGTAVTLANATSVQASFTAPTVTGTTALVFRLVVTDNDGQASSASTVTITVSPALVTLAGTVRYARAPFRTSPVRLDYANPDWLPARGVVVRVLDAGTQATLASGVTTNIGTYSLNVPGNTSVTVQVEARLLRDSSQPLPRWNVRVQNGTGTSQTPYRHAGGVINSTGGNGNVDIPLGISASGTASATNPRASGPFAILDTIYTVIQTTLTAMPNANFPTLYVDWGAQTVGTFFTLSSGAHIALASDLTEDTDEFDQPVIAHEFGHYMQHSFARSDSLGGNHGLGDRLDMRVAFNEGFATGFAAIALNDPIYYDTYVSGGMSVGGGYLVEANPYTVTPTTTFETLMGPACWCSESTVWSLVWDLFDSNIDDLDGVALGFAPVWQALLDTTNAANAPAFVSIFSFIRAVKDNNPAAIGAINALVATQNIDAATIEPFATTETHSPFPNLLPVYTEIVKGTPVLVRSIDDGGPNTTDGDHNKLGAHAFLRYVAQADENVTITVATSNLSTTRDPDFFVYRSGTVVVAATSNSSNAARNEVATLSTVAGTTYIIDAYDCANGCTEAQGTPGDYILSVTIQ